MSERDLSSQAMDRLSRPLALTRAGMVFERATRAFWPVVSILLATGVGFQLVAEDTPITEDEIVAFRSSLDEGDWYSELQAS